MQIYQLDLPQPDNLDNGKSIHFDSENHTKINSDIIMNHCFGLDLTWPLKPPNQSFTWLVTGHWILDLQAVFLFLSSLVFLIPGC